MLNGVRSWQAHSQCRPCLCHSLMKDHQQGHSLHTDLLVSILIFPNESLGVTIKICSFNNPSYLLLLGVVLHSAHMTPWILTTRLQCSQNFTTETKLRTHRNKSSLCWVRSPGFQPPSLTCHVDLLCHGDHDKLLSTHAKYECVPQLGPSPRPQR